jgi:hypothetical protein
MNWYPVSNRFIPMYMKITIRMAIIILSITIHLLLKQKGHDRLLVIPFRYAY